MANINPYLTFSSPNSFTLATANSTKNWDGKLEYSTDLTNWEEWNGITTLNSSGASPYTLYLRGTGNSIIAGGYRKRWTLTGINISCSGNIENLLDYETVIAGEHPNMANSCYAHMFRDCTSLTTAPALPATTLANSCYGYLFYNCASLLTAPELLATTLVDSCYECMFTNCTDLTIAPILPAMTLVEWCYYSMFKGCTSLTIAPTLPATTLANYCYNSMFENCTGLTSTPELPATALANSCYYRMFRNCTSLITTPKLPATILTKSCYGYMFYGCTSLTSTPDLPATTLAENCYRYMFENCTSLITAPELPATTLMSYCYASMFKNCTSLTIAPELPATALANYCYDSMFEDCTSLTTPPELPATVLAENCYNDMFQNADFTISETKTSTAPYPYRVPLIGDGTTATNALTNMFSGVTGNIPTPEINKTYYLNHKPIGGLEVKEVKKNDDVINIKHYHIYTDSTLTENAYTDSAFGAEALYDAYGMTNTEYNTLMALIG